MAQIPRNAPLSHVAHGIHVSFASLLVFQHKIILLLIITK